MKNTLAIAMILALGAGPVLAATTYCTDPTTHKRISCKTTPAKTATATPAKAATATPAKAATPTTAAAKTATAAKPAAATSKTASATTAHKGKKCGNSYIAANKVCHKS